MKVQPRSVISNPKVSVIVPNYNHASFLEKRLNSIIDQTFQDFEVILLDDGSTDNSPEILHRYRNHPNVSHCLLEEQNSGLPFKQWQKGIRRAKGEYIWIAESDDWAELNFLEKLLPRLDEKTGIGFCKSYTYFDAKDELSSYYFPEDLFPKSWNENKFYDGKNLLKKFHSQINVIPNASACIFKKRLAQFDEDLLSMNFCGDWLFWARLMVQTNVYFHSGRLNYWRLSRESIRHRSSGIREKNRFEEMILCIKKIRALTDNKRYRLSNYDWLFMSYYSQMSLWRLPFYKKPEISVSDVSFRGYMIRISIYLFFKKIYRWFKSGE